MASANAAQLIRIARLRRFVAVFARGGDPDAAAVALIELAHASRDAGFRIDALRRARQAAQLLVDQNTGEPSVRALLHLGSLCLDTGAVDAARDAADLARDRAARLPEPARTELTGAASLLAGISLAQEGSEDDARAMLSNARDLLVAAHQPVAAALALLQQGLLDVTAGNSDAADVCFSYARDFYRVVQLPVAALEAAAVAARAFTEVDNRDHAERWFATAIDEADQLGANRLGAELVIDRAAELERAGHLDDALLVASDGARRCALLGSDDANASLLAAVRLQLARLTDDPRDALRHVEAVFELALARRDTPLLGLALDLLVSGTVNQRFPPGTWRLVERFRDRLIGAAFDALAKTATAALADLKR